MAKIQLNGKKITIKTNISIHDLLKKYKLKVLNNENDLNVTKKDIDNISKSKYFIGSDGGMTHVARSLNIPSIVFFRNNNSIYEEVILPYIDNKKQKLCWSEQELIRTIKEYTRMV